MLNREGAAESIRYRVEIGENCISRVVADPSAVLMHVAGDEIKVELLGQRKLGNGKKEIQVRFNDGEAPKWVAATLLV